MALLLIPIYFRSEGTRSWSDTGKNRQMLKFAVCIFYLVKLAQQAKQNRLVVIMVHRANLSPRNIM